MKGEFDRFLESLRLRSYSPASLHAYGQSLATFERFALTRKLTDVREVSREIMLEYMAWLQEQPINDWTRSMKLKAVRRLFVWLESINHILINPCNRLPKQRIGQRLPRAILTQQEVMAILAAPDTRTSAGLRDRAILELFYSTGIRLEEMANLSLEDLELKAGLLRINHGKFAKDRVVPIGENARLYIERYLREVRQIWSRNAATTEALWLNSAPGNYRPMPKATIALLIRKHALAAEITKPVSAHVFRHTCASHMVSNGSNLVHVQQLLGHRSLQTTQVYLRVTIPEVRQTCSETHPRERRYRRHEN